MSKLRKNLAFCFLSITLSSVALGKMGPCKYFNTLPTNWDIRCGNAAFPCVGALTVGFALYECKDEQYDCPELQGPSYVTFPAVQYPAPLGMQCSDPATGSVWYWGPNFFEPTWGPAWTTCYP